MYIRSNSDIVVDSTIDDELSSFIDSFFNYNQTQIVVEDISKDAFRCPISIRTFEWLVMPFSLKNVGSTYQ